MGVRIKASGERERRMEALVLELGEAWNTKGETSIDEFDVSTFQSKIDDSFVFLDGDGASRIDNVSTGRGFGVDRVDGSEDELFLDR